VSPFAVRLRLLDVDSAGNTAGSLYALSTVGSILGSFLPTFLLIPAFGTRNTFLILSLALLLPSLTALVAIRAAREAALAAAMAAIVLLIPVIVDHGLVRPPEYGRVIHEAESAYNYIQILDRNGQIRLALNEGHATHSIYDPDAALTGGPWDYFMVGPYFNADQRPEDVESMLMIGLAAGTTAKQFTAAYGPIPIDGVEIDAEIAEIGREFFDMTEPNLNVIIDDGRYYLTRTDKHYDVIGIDAYRQPYIPFHLTTREFFVEVRDHLSDDGVVVLNAGRTRSDFRLVEAMASTMKDVFPSVYIIDVANFTNSMVIATREPSQIDNFAANISRIDPASLIRQVGDELLATGNIREWTRTDQVFTDDLAPVERVVDQIILRRATEGE
jgi:spermidine synthase